MKKAVFSGLLLIALLAVTAGTAFAASALELVEVRNDNGVPTFVFQVTGEFSRGELENGFVEVGGESYPLYCAQIDEDTVVCHTSKAAAGHDVVVGFGGIRSWVSVPEEAPAGARYCYPVYDWNWPDLPVPPTFWAYYGDHCQEDQAAVGNRITWNNPYLPGIEQYIFGLDESVGQQPNGTPNWSNPGPGYYFFTIK